MQLAGAASVREGTFPIGEVRAVGTDFDFGNPTTKQQQRVWQRETGGGRMHDGLAPGELFVTIPAHHFSNMYWIWSQTSGLIRAHA
jgi:hypothetical protein